MRLLNKLKYFLLLVVIILLGLWLIKPLTISGFYPMHDDTQVTRVFEMAQSLHDGLFPVRWVSDLGYGYGYPIFNFYAPLAYYIGGIFMLFHLSALVATKVMIGISFVLAGISMYILAKSVWGKWGGIFSAFCYLLAPYHALDTYVRGDIAEVYAYAFLPLAWYGIWQAYKTGKWRYVIVGSLGFGGVILSHNLTALMVTPFLLLSAFILVIVQKNTKILHRFYPLIILGIGLLISAFYWLPVFPEMHFTNVLSQVGAGADYHDHFVCLSQLWSSTWGFGGSTAGCIDGISFALGKIYIFVVVAVLLITPFIYRKNRAMGFITLISLIFLIISIFLLLPYSLFIWELIRPLAFLQYPWRFLLLASFFMSFLGGGLIWFIKQYVKKSVFILVITLILSGCIVFLESRYFVPQYIYPTNGSKYTQKQAITWNISKISDEYMPKNFEKPMTAQNVPQQLIASSTGKVQVVMQNTQTKILKISSKQSQKIELNLAYFPAWHALLDGNEVPIQQTNRGIAITVPAGNHMLSLLFRQTQIEMAGDIISVVGIMLLILGIILFVL